MAKRITQGYHVSTGETFRVEDNWRAPKSKQASFKEEWIGTSTFKTKRSRYRPPQGPLPKDYPTCPTPELREVGEPRGARLAKNLAAGARDDSGVHCSDLFAGTMLGGEPRTNIVNSPIPTATVSAIVVLWL